VINLLLFQKKIEAPVNLPKEPLYSPCSGIYG